MAEGVEPQTGPLVSEVFAVARILVAERWRNALPAWIGSLLVSIAQIIADGLSGSTTIVHLLVGLLGAVISFVFVAGSIRALLGYTDGIFSLNRDFWRYLGFTFLLSVPLIIFVLLLMLPITFWLPTVLLLLLSVALLVVAMSVALNGFLWPLGAVVGDKAITFDVSSYKMHGAKLTTLACWFIVVVCFGVPKWLLKSFDKWFATGGSIHWVLSAAQAIISAASAVTLQALGAAIFVIVYLGVRRVLPDTDVVSD